jgi:hypothetical protein
MSVETSNEAPIRQAARPLRGTSVRLREALLSVAAGQASVVSHTEKSWASITFAGTRHRLELTFTGDEAVAARELFIAFLPEHEFTLPGQLVADAAVVAVDHKLLPEPVLRVSIELLLLEEG